MRIVKKTLNEGVCKWCGRLVRWEEDFGDYHTVEPPHNLTCDSTGLTDHIDHLPEDKSTHFSRLYDRLRTV